MELHDLKPKKGSNKSRKRLGRGSGSGSGSDNDSHRQAGGISIFQMMLRIRADICKCKQI